MNNSTIDRYCRKVGRKLVCSRQSKQALLDGLKQELREAVSREDCSLGSLEEKYGKTDAVAEELQQSISAEERNRVSRGRKIKWIVLVTVVIVLLVLIILLLMRFFPLYQFTELPNELPKET